MTDSQRASASNYLKAFRASWFLLMSGPLTVPFTFFAIVGDGALQKTAFAILAAICGGYSSFSVWAHEREARNNAESRLASFLATAPKIISARLANAKARLPIGDPESEFDILVDILIAEKTAFGDDWALDISFPLRAVTVNGHRGRIASGHSCDVGRYELTVTFPFSPAIPDRETLVGGTILRLAGVDAQHRAFSS